jgi:hypothetical protein
MCERKDESFPETEESRAFQETFYLMSIPGMAESIKEGLNTPIEEMDEGPGW